MAVIFVDPDVLLGMQYAISHHLKYRLAWMASLPIFAFAVLALLDVYLPAKHYQEIPIEGWQERTGRRSYATYMRTERRVISVPAELHIAYDYDADKKKPLLIAITPMLKLVKEISVVDGNAMSSYRIIGTPYLLWLLLVSAGFTALNRRFSPWAAVFSFMPLLLLGIVILRYFL